MDDTRYDAVVDQIEALYGESRYADAVAVLESATGLEPWSAELAHLRACVLGASGDADGSLKALQDGLDQGGWWRPEILTDDDDLAALADRPEFQALVAESTHRAADDPTPALITRPTKPIGVVVALHGAGQRAAHAQRDWASVLDLGYALVCVESSRRMSPMYRTWPDPEQAAADIARGLAELPHNLAGLPLVAAGFSAGGRVAIDWAMTARPARVSGVLAVAPALRKLPEASANSLHPATIWIGTDDDLLEVVDAAEPQLAGITIDRVPGLRHTFPADLAERIARTVGA
ncbi:phospholipase [Kribbella antibiotica]|uniref:Phospholipase n=1 Tax=Kribbella antibiotica TaxID=190195 RepID=A0A4R4Z3U4_9ACTN|nr:alpha/beta hydrolase [Kribbella antibiotica]TDD52663.1 phospholipase [Kribbella antibiotica]